MGETPVGFSPAKTSPGLKVTPGKNLTGNQRLIRDLAADVHASIQQWNTLHLNGVSLVKTITQLKTDESYNEELKVPCQNLEIICDEADKVVENLKLCAERMKAISSLHKTKENIFTTWPIEKFVTTTEAIYEAYKKEAGVKRIILENVAHDHRKAVKTLHIVAWLHQTQIPESVTIKLEAMLTETKLR